MITKRQFAAEVTKDMADYLLVEDINLADDPYNYTPLYVEDAWDIFECAADKKDVKNALSGLYDSWDLFMDVIRKARYETLTREEFERKFGYPYIRTI